MFINQRPKYIKYLVFSVIFILIFGSKNYAQDTIFLRESIEKWKNSMDYTMEVAASMPDSLFDFKPTNEEMAFGEQLQHISKNMCWLATTHLIEGGEFVEDDIYSKKLSPDSIRILVSECYLFALNAIKNVDLNKLNVTNKFFAGHKSKRQIIHLMNDHATHHRGQIIVYLRLNGIKPPRYRGW
jgi:hypothetical protein